MALTDKRTYLKPLNYPFAYNFAEDHRRMNWTREEVRTLHEDVSDWENNLPIEEKTAYQYLLNYFTQADVDVAGSYFENLARWYTQPELRMALARIIDREATHVTNYDMLPDQFGIPQTEYAEMLEIDEVYDQHQFMATQINGSDFWTRISTIIKHICGEGIGLYGIFIMLLNAQRFGVMKCLGQEIVSWSSKDENHHVEFLTWLFNTELEENPTLITVDMAEAIIQMFKTSVERGVAYAKSVYKHGSLRDLTVEQIETFLKQLANARIKKLNIGVEVIYPDVPKHVELTWASMLFGGSLDNFFETAGTNYQLGAMTGEWEYPTETYLTDHDEMLALAQG